MRKILKYLEFCYWQLTAVKLTRAKIKWNIWENVLWPISHGSSISVFACLKFLVCVCWYVFEMDGRLGISRWMGHTESSILNIQKHCCFVYVYIYKRHYNVRYKKMKIRKRTVQASLFHLPSVKSRCWGWVSGSVDKVPAVTAWASVFGSP